MDLFMPKVMAILNVTPDSFYDGGRYLNSVEIQKRIEQVLNEGADMIDVGACSTRPGAEVIDQTTELARLRLAFDTIRSISTSIPLSVDTFRSEVARWAVENYGVEVVNDISAGNLDSAMMKTVSQLPVYYVLMHMQGRPENMQVDPVYQDVTQEISQYFLQKTEMLNQMGFDRIILDPGFGFGKTVSHNYEILAHLDHFLNIGYPLMVGLSRKSMIYKKLGITPDEALNGTTVIHTLALMKGARLLRVHDVKEAKECIELIQSTSSC